MKPRNLADYPVDEVELILFSKPDPSILDDIQATNNTMKFIEAEGVLFIDYLNFSGVEVN